MTLTIQDLGAIGELLGSVAVLATLVYLTLQTRQNTMAIGAQLDAARITSVASLSLAPIASNELLEALNEDRVDSPPIGQERRGQFWYALFMNFQWQLHQARRGLLPTFSEAGMEAGLRRIFTSFRSSEGWWETTKLGFSPEFVDEQRSKAA